MRITITSNVEYRPAYTVRGDINADDPGSVMEWVADIRKTVATITKELEEACANGEQIGVTVEVDQQTRRARIVGYSQI